MTDHIKYRDGYKYQLAETYSTPISIFGIKAESKFIQLWENGALVILEGYAWDGPSGPTIDTPDSMRASLVHDALYQLMREGKLPLKYRDVADQELRRRLLEDGMDRIRADGWFEAVRLFAAGAADPRNSKPIKVAP